MTYVSVSWLSPYEYETSQPSVIGPTMTSTVSQAASTWSKPQTQSIPARTIPSYKAARPAGPAKGGGRENMCRFFFNVFSNEL